MDFDKYIIIGEWITPIEMPDNIFQQAAIHFRAIMPNNKREGFSYSSTVCIPSHEKEESNSFSLNTLKLLKTKRQLIPLLKSYVNERLDIGCMTTAKKRAYQVEFGDWEISPAEAKKINDYYKAMSKKETDSEYFIPVTEIEVCNPITGDWELINA